MGIKYANKLKWKKVREKEYRQKYIDNSLFTGYIAYIKFLEVEGQLVHNIINRKLITADKDYIWLQLFPIDKNYCITIMFDDMKNIIKWYVDIVKRVGLTEDNFPYMEDMYLDLVILPNGEYEILDRDELDEALENKEITIEEYNNAIIEIDSVKRELIDNLDRLKKLSIDSLNEFEKEK